LTVRVRRARQVDLPSLLVLFEELDRLQRDWRLFTPRPGMADEVAAKYGQALTRRDVLVAVAEDEGEPVGMAFAEATTPSRFSDERALELSGVIVRADRRREGIGRLLIREALRYARERDLGWVTLQTFGPNRSAMEFWEALGFTPRVVQLVAPLDDVSRRLGDT
jgi:ribosomal protein S18 acetylase RimI-like enzyme